MRYFSPIFIFCAEEMFIHRQSNINEIHNFGHWYYQSSFKVRRLGCLDKTPPHRYKDHQQNTPQRHQLVIEFPPLGDHPNLYLRP